jgi:hypothetical protein
LLFASCFMRKSILAILPLALSCLAVLLAPRPASAFTIETPATQGCHESLAIAGYRRAQALWPDVIGPLASRGDDEALMADVPFKVPKSLRSIGPVALLLGVRDNDIKEHGATDLKNLTPAASQPAGQAEHCLRAIEQDGPDGSRQAVESCRTFIRETLLSALDGLDDAGRVSNDKRETFKVSLAIRDEIDVDVPMFFLRAGRGLHAIQDSFTHTFRNPEQPGKIRVVLNFVEYTQGTLDEAVDGPAHASELDVCDDPDELRTERHALAAEASGVAMMALLDPSLDRRGKEQAVDAMLDEYVAYDTDADCKLDNGWCDAPETVYGSPPLGCQLSSRAPRSGVPLLLTALVGAVLALRRRRLAGLLSLSAVCCSIREARADEEKSGPIDGPASAFAGTSEAARPGKLDKAGAFFGRVATGASYDNAAFSTGLGIRYQFARNWMVGLDGEWNPYVATELGKVRPGSANAYFSLIRRFQLRYASVNLRSYVSAGGSLLLFDLVGADKYSKGPYFGINFLGVEWKMARGFYLTVDPTSIAIPIPNVVGVPFMYVQYRFLVGLEFGG